MRRIFLKYLPNDLRVVSVCIFAVISVLLSSCTSMTDTSTLDTALAKSKVTCHSSLGAYSLPKRIIKVEVKKQDASDGVSNRDGFGIKIGDGNLVADRKATFCLDFLASPLAAERIGVKRNGMLLQRVYTQSDDKSRDIATKLVNAAADLSASNKARLPVARNQSFQSNSNGVLKSFDVDPMSEQEMRDLNIALREFGYCVYLSRAADPFVPSWSEDVCKHAMAYKAWKSYLPSPQRSGLKIMDKKPLPRSVQRRGVLYRPELSHNLIVMRQESPGVKGAPWYRLASKRLKLPNASPPFLMEIKRALFVEAKTDIRFNNGVMQTVAIHKPSELLAVSEFTIEAVQIVQAIPAKTLAIFSNRADNLQKLIEANQTLIETLKAQNPEASRKDLTPGVNEVIRGRSTARSFVNRNAGDETYITECLRTPAAQQSENPVQFCEDILASNR